MSVLHFDRFNELFCLHYPVNVLSVLCFKVSVRLSVHLAASASVELLISNFRPLCRRPLLSPSPPSSHKQLYNLLCSSVWTGQKFQDRYDEISKFISCSSSPIAIATFPQMTLKLMLLACFCQRWNMEYLKRYFLHLLPQTTQFVPAF